MISECSRSAQFCFKPRVSAQAISELLLPAKCMQVLKAYVFRLFLPRHFNLKHSIRRRFLSPLRQAFRSSTLFLSHTLASRFDSDHSRHPPPSYLLLLMLFCAQPSSDVSCNHSAPSLGRSLVGLCNPLFSLQLLC